MAGYIGSKASVTQVDGYNTTEADAEFVNDPNGVITVDSGNVGIGTTSVGYTNANRNTLQVNGSTSSIIALAYGGTNAGYMYADSSLTQLWSEGTREFNLGTAAAGPITFKTNNAERMRIDSAGRVTMPYQPAFKANYDGSTFTVAANTIITHNQQIFDVGGVFNPSTSRFTAPIAGKYMMLFQIIYTGTENSAWVEFRINGSASGAKGLRMHFGSSTGGWKTVYMNCVLDLSANDYVEVHNGNQSVDYHGDDWHSWSGYLLG